ncbi:MAG: hypothetical protein ACRDWT_00555 [Jatrophihabitantaceae bacterium]
MRRLLARHALARSIGLGRLVFGTALLLAPVASTRVLGLDTATAKRVSFLARMTAARDIAIGAGTAAAAGRRPVGWLLAGAAADACDAVVIAQALRSGRLRGPIATGVVGGAAAVSALAVVGAASSCRRPG